MAAGLERGLRYGIAALWLLACGGAVGKPTVGGESHFLRHCGDGCGKGLQCFSDICTRGCVVGQDTCSDLEQSALCTNASVEPGALAVCDVACSSNQDCRGLGSNFECSGGFCRDAAPVVPEPTGSAGAGASTSTGGEQPTAGGAQPSGGSGAAGAISEPWTPAPQCALPFDAGSCRGAQPVFAAINGQCVSRLYGGCEGNENRFRTLEECLSVCEGRPAIEACPSDRLPQTICLECGPAGGCSKLGTFCAQACDDTHPCDSLQCYAGTCQAFGCI